MEEIYWITRLSNLNGVAYTCLILSIFAFIVVMIVYFCTMGNYCKDERDIVKKFARKWRLAWIIIFLFGLLGNIFIPTQKEILLIYGLGSTIDYIKYNEKTKQLPDKAVDALSRYLDEVGKEDKK